MASAIAERFLGKVCGRDVVASSSDNYEKLMPRAESPGNFLWILV
jgi:hypothetical protein